jgi:hypothetical protein
VHLRRDSMQKSNTSPSIPPGRSKTAQQRQQQQTLERHNVAWANEISRLSAKYLGSLWRLVAYARARRDKAGGADPGRTADIETGRRSLARRRLDLMQAELEPARQL